MQAEFAVASVAIFGLGFLAGYLARAMISLRRRRATLLAGWPTSEHVADRVKRSPQQNAD